MYNGPHFDHKLFRESPWAPSIVAHPIMGWSKCCPLWRDIRQLQDTLNPPSKSPFRFLELAKFYPSLQS